MYTTLKNTSKRSGTAYISKNRSLYNVVFTVRNYHSLSDQVHPRNNLFKTSRRTYQVDRLSQTIICIKCIERESSSKVIFLIKLYFCEKLI